MVIWETTEDFAGEQDSSGVTYDELGDHPVNSLIQGYTYANINEGLVAYYPMDYDQSTHVHDATYNGNDGVASGATRVGGQVGSGAFDFDGTDDYIDLFNQSSPLIPQTDDWTFSAWFKADVGNDRPIFSQYEEFNSNGRFIIRIDDVSTESISVFLGGDGDNSSTKLISLISLNTWTHITATRNGDDFKLYVDGVLEDSATITNYDVLQCGNLIGRRTGSETTYNSPSGGSNFDGTIDEVRIYDRALSSGEVKALYNVRGPRPVVQTADPREGLVSEYKLEGDATDSVGTNDGTVNGATFTTAYDGQGADFDGTDDYIDGPFEDWNNFNAWTVSLWVNSDSTSDSIFFFHEEDGSYGRAQLSIRNGDWTFGVFDGSQTQYAIGTQANTGEWVHLVGIMIENDGLYLYENGVLQDINTSFSTQGPAAANIVFGFNSGTNDRYLDGTLDEARIYDRALTDVEVQQLYDLGQKKINKGDNL